MYLIADSGSTKTEWVAVDARGRHLHLLTGGLNPVFASGEQIAAAAGEAAEALRPRFAPLRTPHAGSGTPWRGLHIRFFGAGCSEERIPGVAAALAAAFPGAEAEVRSDMTGAALGLCGTAPGVVCILGTGSNSCLWDGSRIAANVPPLGFILGDEGSGASLGIALVNRLFKGALPRELSEELLRETGLSLPEVIERVYRSPQPNRFLASLSPVILRHIDHPLLRELAEERFTAFLRRNVARYDRRDLPVHFTGSVAWFYREPLCAAVRREGFFPGRIVRSPMEGLCRHYIRRAAAPQHP